MGAAQYVVRCWTCACGDRFLAWPEEHIEDYMLWHQRAFHQRGTDGRYRSLYVVNPEFGDAPATQEVAE